MASTAQQIIDRIKGQLPPTAGNYFSDQDYVDAYNDALDELSDATECYERSMMVKRRKWAVYTDMRGILPTTALRVTAVWNPITNKWLDPTTARELDKSVGRGWERNIDSSRWWFMRGLWFLGTYPIPGDDLSPLKVYFSATLPHIELDGGLATGLTTSPGVPPDYDAAIEHYMLYSIFGDFRENQKAIDNWSKYKELELQLKTSTGQRMMRDRTYRIGARR